MSVGRGGSYVPLGILPRLSTAQPLYDLNTQNIAPEIIGIKGGKMTERGSGGDLYNYCHPDMKYYCKVYKRVSDCIVRASLASAVSVVSFIPCASAAAAAAWAAQARIACSAAWAAAAAAVLGSLEAAVAARARLGSRAAAAGSGAARRRHGRSRAAGRA